MTGPIDPEVVNTPSDPRYLAWHEDFADRVRGTAADLSNIDPADLFQDWLDGQTAEEAATAYIEEFSDEG